MLDIDFVIETSLVAIYSNNLLSDQLFLKGGQALRVKEKIKNRFSADIDFSFATEIADQDIYFEMLREALASGFYGSGYYLFDFSYNRKPRFKKEGTPDFWSGWGVEFKLVPNSKRNLSKADLSRSGLVPKGASSPKITLDISEHEYCGSVEKVKVKCTDVNVYSRKLLILEKIRAICQQHPEYPLKSVDQRARDYYDIEQLWVIVLKEENAEVFLEECAKHIKLVFDAKGVNLELLENIFEPAFVELQKNGWKSVQNTVSGKLESFEYYIETLKFIVSEIKKRLIE